MSAFRNTRSAESPETEGLPDRFRRLADAWEEATAHHSADHARFNHPAHQEIVSLGEPVVPLLLRDLEENGRHWFAALRSITGSSPVPKEDAGNVPKMVEAWIRWGRENGYRW